FVFLTLRPPPGATLFPYTTLFRSGRPHELLEVGGDLGRVGDEVHRAEQRRRDLAELVDLPSRAHAACVALEVARDVADRGREVRDRKSTRLNSSHVKISYAVFCLK